MSKFTNTEGLITFQYRPIAYLFNGVLLIASDARNGFKPEDNAAFDKLIYDDLKSTSREYVTLTSFFDPDERFKQFKLDANSLDKYGLKFSDDEKNLMKTYRDYDAKIQALTVARDAAFATTSVSVIDKIKEKFVLPKIKYEFTSKLDLVKLFGGEKNAAEAEAWLNNPSSTTVDAYSLTRKVTIGGNRNWNLLRQYTTTRGNVRIQTLDGQTLTLVQAKRIWDAVKESWRTGAYKTNSWGSNLGFTVMGYGVQGYDTYVKVGCQEVPRAEVERIAQLNGWS